MKISYEPLTPLEMLHTPQVLDARTLEDCLGERRELVDSLSRELEEGLGGEGGSHVVIDGGPGAGKSHVLEALVRRQLARDEDERPLVARAGAGGVRRLLDLGLRWVGDLSSRRADPQMVGRRLALARLPAGAATQAALGLVGEVAGEGPLLLVIEGVDEVVGRVGWSDWERFEKVLSRRPRWKLLVTARQASPGRGREWVEVPRARTRVAHLDPLSASQMRALAGSVLEAGGESGAAAVAAARCADAFGALVGGSPRTWLAFVAALRREPAHPERAFLIALDRLMRDLDDTLLSPQQRLLVEELALVGAPLTVKDLASACYVSHQTATAQLGHLRAAGVVRAGRRGRHSLYELSDPGLESVIRLERGDSAALVESFLFLVGAAGAAATPSATRDLFLVEPELWRAGVETLFDDDAGSPGARRQLGLDLAGTLPGLLAGDHPLDATRLWRDLWWEWGGRFSELRPALGALAGAQRVREDGAGALALLPRADQHVIRRMIALAGDEEGTG